MIFMTIKYVFNRIKKIDLIYLIEEKYNEDLCANIKENHYLGTDYCRKVMNRIQERFPEIKNCIYKGQTGRIANEEYSIEVTKKTYSVLFTIDTFNDKSQAQLEIHIFLPTDSNEYDIFLEKFKVYLKDILIKEWKICTWVIDEQSENLGMQLYPLIFKAENKMRAFINKVMTHNLGFNWSDLFGLGNIKKGYNEKSLTFKREVPEFNNINDYLICITAESLAKLMLESKVYEPSINFSDEESKILNNKIAENNPNAVFDFLIKNRKVKIDIWNDLFKKYFDEKIEEEISDFIKNRNHVAHNKLLTKASYDKMKENILEIQTLFDEADRAFMIKEPSDELYETWNIEQEQIEHIYYRIELEAGIDVLFPEQIFSLFEDKIHELYTEIDDLEYFSYAVKISSLCCIENKPKSQILFSVNSNVDETFSFKVCCLIYIIDGMGEDSCLNLWIEKEDGEKLLETEIIYHNGEAHEEIMEGHYVPDSESSLDDQKLKEFTENLKNHIKDDMNPIKAKADLLFISAAKDGGDLPVAHIPCWNCGQDYISINENLYPYGKCMNCGEENEILVCEKCGNIYLEGEGAEFCGINLCNYCFEEIEE